MPWPKPSTACKGRTDSSPSALENGGVAETRHPRMGTWFNHQRLLEPIGYIPPAEAEERYYLQLIVQADHACT